MIFKEEQVSEHAFPFPYDTIKGEVTSSPQRQDVLGKVNTSVGK